MCGACRAVSTRAAIPPTTSSASCSAYLAAPVHCLVLRSLEGKQAAAPGLRRGVCNDSSVMDAATYYRQLQAEIDRVNRENQRRVDGYNRKVEQHNRREIDRVNRENQRRVDEYNRKAAQHNQGVLADQQRAEQHNQRVVADHNREISQVNAHNQATVAELNRQLRAAAPGPRYTVDEQALADRVQHAVTPRDDREWDVFLSYARIDGAQAGEALCRHLESLGVRVWFDASAIAPGKSQALQMDKGLQKARAGVVLLTPADLVGRFWTEPELGALLHKETLIPVLDGVTFDQVAEYSGILPDLAGFQTSRDSIEVVAEKIAAAVIGG